MPARDLHPALTPIDPQALVRVLDSASATAARSWDGERCDIYHCLFRAWRAAAMPIPVTSLTAALREQLTRSHRHLGDVMEFNDIPGMTATVVAEFIAAARDGVATNVQVSGLHRFEGPRSLTGPSSLGDQSDEFVAAAS